jgi:hypothetical protein
MDQNQRFLNSGMPMELNLVQYLNRDILGEGLSLYLTNSNSIQLKLEKGIHPSLKSVTYIDSCNSNSDTSELNAALSTLFAKRLRTSMMILQVVLLVQAVMVRGDF